MADKDFILEEVPEEEGMYLGDDELVIAEGNCFECLGEITQVVDISQEADDCVSFDRDFCVFCETWAKSDLPKHNN